MLTAITAVLLVVASCSSDSGPDEATGSSSSSSGTGGMGGAPPASSTTSSSSSSAGGDGGGGPLCASLGDPCTVCLAANCQESYCRCQERAECSAAMNCLLGCPSGDVACFPDCMSVHTVGAVDALAEGSCQIEKCDIQCLYDNGLSVCQKCIVAKCPAEMSVCGANVECIVLLGCVQACRADVACRNECLAAHPGGVEDSQGVLACSGAACTTACQ